MINIRIGDDVIQNIPSVRNMGLHFDEELKHSSHVNKLTSVLFNMIHNLARIHHQLDIEMTKTLVQALVLSHLNYCNCMLLGIPNYNIQKIQHMLEHVSKIYTATTYKIQNRLSSGRSALAEGSLPNRIQNCNSNVQMYTWCCTHISHWINSGRSGTWSQLRSTNCKNSYHSVQDYNSTWVLFSFLGTQDME